MSEPKKYYRVVILDDESKIESELNAWYDFGYELEGLETEFTKFILIFRLRI